MRVNGCLVAAAVLAIFVAFGCSKKADAPAGTGEQAAAGAVGMPAVSPKDFSATVTMKTTNGSFDGKIYVTPDRIRTEMPQVTSITRMDKGVIWIFMPGQKVYMEQPLKAENMVSFGEKLPGEIKREVQGEEVVEGKQVVKYLITYDIGDTEASAYQWIAKDSGMPIRMAGSDWSWSYSFTDIKPGVQVAELFEIPDGYMKFDMSNMHKPQ